MCDEMSTLCICEKVPTVSDKHCIAHNMQCNKDCVEIVVHTGCIKTLNDTQQSEWKNNPFFFLRKTHLETKNTI